MHELRDTHPIGGGYWIDDEVTGGDIAQKANLGFNAQTRRNQVGNFSDHQGGNDQGTGMISQKLE